jgi:hypothetical protein
MKYGINDHSPNKAVCFKASAPFSCATITCAINANVGKVGLNLQYKMPYFLKELKSTKPLLHPEYISKIKTTSKITQTHDQCKSLRQACKFEI